MLRSVSVAHLSINEQKLLFLRVADGDTLAFREIFDLYRLRLYAAAKKITQSDYGAEEIVQEVFTSLWEGRNNLCDVDNPPAYIFTIGYNKAFRYLKKVSTDAVMLQSLKHRTMEGHTQTEEWLESRETQHLIHQAVAMLPPQRRQIYLLSREEGMSHDEIAQRLCISPFTVKKQVSLALQGIRTTLTKTAPLLAFFFL